jgi:hypothetical protein
MIDRNGSPNKVYNNAIKATIDEDGNRTDLYNMMFDDEGDQLEWYELAKAYAEKNDKDIGEVLNTIITAVMDESGEPEIRFKNSIGL